MNKQILLERLTNKQAIIGIIGLGYVGLPLALRYAEVGYKVIGFDIDQSKVDRLNAGKSYLAHIPDKRVQEDGKDNFQATVDYSNISEVDAIILCVPTPLDKYREPDLSFIDKTMEMILPHIRKGQVISLESTTYPGNTDEVLKPLIESQNFTIGEDFFLIYSPEREDPGNTEYGTSNIPKVCGGCDKHCLDIGIALYEQVVTEVVPVSSTRAAEMTKLLENIHRSVNIGLMNELKVLADKMQLDIYEIIDAAATKPFGFTKYYPGPGIGGHCIPIDPFYLTWKAREFGMHTRFIELAGEINSNMPKWVVHKTADVLNREAKAIKGSKILILGIAYKRNVDDLRESPSLFIMDHFIEKGALVSFSDPHVPTMPRMYQHDLQGDSVALTPENIAEFDCCVICTAHEKFDYELIQKNARLIIDTRGVYREHYSNVVKA